MELDIAKLAARDRYKLLTALDAAQLSAASERP
jgi:hypothetical protein